MAWYSRHSRGFAPYVPVAEKRAKARRRADAAGQKLTPVTVEGRAIATTFWGKAWCDHLESYSDYSNRLPRGRTYLRNGYVIDLQIQPGQVRALVSGSSLYKVKVDVAPLDQPKWRDLVLACVGKIDSVVELLTGELSNGVMAVLCGPEKGLFPSSKQMSLSCSCPDGAWLCKHLAAVLYGVGARLDSEPELFFTLRGVDKLDLIGEAASGGLAADSGSRAGELESGELSSIFGIEVDAGAPVAPALPVRKGRAKTETPKKPAPAARRGTDKPARSARPTVAQGLATLEREHASKLMALEKALARVRRAGKAKR